MASDYLCNLIIPGAAKSGTSSLHELLDHHPDICMSTPKEPQFFSFNERFELGATHHNKLFSKCATKAYKGESSQCYFTHLHAMDRIKLSLHDPKIIIMLRNPIDRLLSQYAWNYKRGTETETFENAVKLRGENTSYIFDQRIRTYREAGGYVAFSRYTRWVPEWQKRFGKENVLILKFENMRQDQQKSFDLCCEFLGLDRNETPTLSHRNSTETTQTKILPSYVFTAAKLVPDKMKHSVRYRKFVGKIRGYYTKSPDLSIGNNFRNSLEKHLGDDIQFHSNLMK